MGATDPGGRVPVENTAQALRRLAPGAGLRTPRDPNLRALAKALRSCSPAELARVHPEPVVRVVLADQLRALDRAMTGLFGPETRCPEAARLVRAARYSRTWRTGVAGELLGRLRAEPGLRAAALGWAEVAGCRILAGELRGVPVVPGEEDGRRAAELAVAAVLPRPELDVAAGGGTGSDGGQGAGRTLGETGFGPPVHHPAPSGHPGPTNDLLPDGPPTPTSGFLDVSAIHLGERGFRVDVNADPPVDLVHDGHDLTLRALWWNGLGRVTDDLGHEYLILAKDRAGTGVVRHWCHPRPARGARVLRLESAGYRGERLRLAPAAPGTCADVLVKLELTVRLGA